MDEQEHKAWIASLKPGDEVETHHGGGRWSRVRLTHVGPNKTIPTAIEYRWGPYNFNFANAIRPVQAASAQTNGGNWTLSPAAFVRVGGNEWKPLPKPPVADVVPRFLHEETVAKLTTEVEALQRALAHAAEREAELGRQLARERAQSTPSLTAAAMTNPELVRVFGDLAAAKVSDEELRSKIRWADVLDPEPAPDDPRSAGLLALSGAILGRNGR